MSTVLPEFDPAIHVVDHEPCMIYSDCITVEDFIPKCRECDEQPATKIIMLDAVNNGMTVAFGNEMCADCAVEMAQALRESLPVRPPEEDSSPHAQPTAVHENEIEPNMARTGEKHIKPCRGCDALILWAKHVGTGKAAPLVKVKEGEKPNITAWFDESSDQWFYAIVGTQEHSDTASARGLPEYVNHFSNCPRSKDFRSAPLNEDEQRQAQIK